MIRTNSFRGPVRGIQWLALAAVAAGTLALSSPARAAVCPAPPSYLLRYLTSVATYPSAPNLGQPTTLWLYGWFPYDCGHVSSAQILDATHLQVTLQSGGTCADTTCWWSTGIDLGMLPAGQHNYDLALVAVTPDSGTITRHTTVGFFVSDTIPPPPGPKTCPSGFLPHVVRWSLDPAIPNTTDPATVTLLGWFPYFCGEIASAQVVDADHIEVHLAPGPACSDTAQMWTRVFDLGVLSAGSHSINVKLTLSQTDSLDKEENGQIEFDVPEPGQSLSSPPPDDSLRIVLSRSRPNPFASMTRFSVSLQDPAAADVSIFDLAGRRVATLFRGNLPSGTSQFAWNGLRADGSRAVSGMYFYRLALPKRVITRRVVLLGQP